MPDGNWQTVKKSGAGHYPKMSVIKRPYQSLPKLQHAFCNGSPEFSQAEQEHNGQKVLSCNR